MISESGRPSARMHGRPRWWAVTGAVVVLLLLVGAAASLWVPHHRPALRAGEVYGVDVSNHQGDIDWPALADDGVAFAYIKASEGGDFTDDRFAENWSAADRAGVQRGAYHFFTLCRPGGQQAVHFLRTAPPDTSALPPAIDLELAGNCAARPDRDAVYAELDTFLSAVEAAWGRQTVLYVGADWEGAYPVLDRSERPRWLVSFVGRPDVRWTVWQYAWWGRVEGVEGRVDLDVARIHELG